MYWQFMKQQEAQAKTKPSVPQPDKHGMVDPSILEHLAAEEEVTPSQGYSWTQQEDAVEITIPVAKGTKAKAVKVGFGTAKLTVVVAGEEIIAGKLAGPVDVDECTWTVADNVLEITLAKVDNDKYQRQWGSLLA